MAVIAIASALAMAACRGAPAPGATSATPTSDDDRHASALTAVSRTNWAATASASSGSNAAQNAINTSTGDRWTTGVAQANGQWFQVNMAAPRTFLGLRMDTTPTPTDYPRAFEVKVSNDGTTWSAPIYSGTGSGSVITVQFAPQTAQYIRVTLANLPTPAPTQSWSIYEFNVYDTSLSRTGWTATASSSSSSAGNALDGNTSTRWTSTTPQTNQTFTVDMKSPRTFSQISLDTGSANANNFPRAYSVQVSTDNVTWSSPIATGANSSRFLVVNFSTQLAQYVRVTETATNATAWTIEELNVSGQPTTQTAQPRVAWVATASPNTSGNVPANALDGSATTRWTSSSTQAAGMFFQVDMLTVRTFDQVTLDAGSTSTNFPRAWQLQVSNNASSWTTVTSGTGTTALVTITFSARTARHVRINLTMVNSNPWSIQEMNVTGPAFSRTGWVATGSSTNGSSVAGDAIDASTSTRWTTSGAQTGQSFTVDMGTAQIFNQITLDSGSTTSNNFPRGYSVSVSNDGTTWGAPVATGTGTTRLVTINLLTQTARSVRIEQTATDATPWTIEELNVWRIAGLCDAVTCTASDQCHDVGVCDASSGVCSNPNKMTGSGCNDGNACTTGETCQGGSCTNGSAVTCTTDQCHNIGACVPATGCPAPTDKPNGTTCNDGNACTTGESCQAGSCSNGSAVTCTADQCHDAGACVPGTGCPAPTNRPDGSGCNDGDACTQFDVCQAGVCQGPTMVSCAAPDQCHDAGTCNSAAPSAGPPSTQDLVGWWKLDGNGLDSSGGGHDLDIEGNVVPAPGRFGLGMKFDGASCMTAPVTNGVGGPTVWEEARMAGAEGVTMMAWVNPSTEFTCPHNAAVMGRGNDGSPDVRVGGDHGDLKTG